MASKNKKNPAPEINTDTGESASPKEATPRVISATQRRINETIYKPLIREAIAAVEKQCNETAVEFTIGAVCKKFSELAEESFSANRFRDTLNDCGFGFRRITVIQELPAITGTPE